MKESKNRPTTLFEVAEQAQSLEEFGLLLRDWIHHITRRDVSNRPALLNALQKLPPSLEKKFGQGEVADAYSGRLCRMDFGSGRNTPSILGKTKAQNP